MLYLLHGPNKHYKEKICLSIKDNYPGYSFYSFNINNENNVNRIEQLLKSTFLFDPPNIIIYIKDYEFIEDPDYLLKVAAQYKESTREIIVLDTNVNIRKNAKILKFIYKVFSAEEYSLTQLTTIAENILQREGATDYIGITRELLKRTYQNGYYIENECYKIGLLSKVSQVNKDSLDKFISPSINYSIWEYLRYLVKGEKEKSLLSIIDMLNKGENEFSIIAMILWNIRLITILKLADNKDTSIIMKDFKYNIYSINNTRPLLENFSIKKINTIYEKLIELEFKIKNGLITPRLGLILISFIF